MGRRRLWTALLALLALGALAVAGVSEVRLRQCRDDRAQSRDRDLISCERSLFGRVRRGGEIATRPLPRAPEVLRVESPAFAYAGSIPAEHGCRGADRPPPLRWRGSPRETRAHAVLAVDNAPREWVVRWALLDLPADARSIDADAPRGVAARNSLGERGYRGPCAGDDGIAAGVSFHVYALDRPVDLARDATLDTMFDRVNAAAIATGEVSGQYDP